MSSLYYQNGNLRSARVILLESFEENERNYVKLRDDFFYPQGGGQKGDRGLIICGGQEYKVVNTIKDKSGVGALVITDRLVAKESVGEEIECILDWDFRYRQMKLHTCLHLHHCILEETVGKRLEYPVTSDIEDGFAFNKYPVDAFDKSIIDEANIAFMKVLKSDAEVLTYPNKEKEGYRWWECLNYKIPCGGIHVSNLKEIENVSIKVSSKRGFVTIKLTLEEM